MAIYITGDTHGDFDRIQEFCDYTGTTQSDDIMIVLGDAGINYFLDRADFSLKEELLEHQITYFCIHGNHEERPDMIDSYEEVEWHGGIVYMEEDYPNLVFAKDGEIYDFDGKKSIVIGGAYSIDKMSRISSGAPWFETEQPDEGIMDYVESQLDKVGWKIDFVLSHTAPLKYEPVEEFIPNYNQAYIDKSTEKWLDTIEKHLKYERWFLGHYHCDKRSGRITIMFEEIEELF